MLVVAEAVASHESFLLIFDATVANGTVQLTIDLLNVLAKYLLGEEYRYRHIITQVSSALRRVFHSRSSPRPPGVSRAASATA